MRRISFSIALIISFISLGNEGNKPLSQQDYISIWSNVAIDQMHKFHIPASITLAQGILESGNGNSPLATQANNHFGIKCHDWTGEKAYFDDDAKQECFRKYTNAEESYKDHSLFLSTKARYSSLFQLPIDDYINWAKGLKKAGYATHPQYAEKLIELVERLQLYTFDLKSPQEISEQLLAKELEKEQYVSVSTIDARALNYKAHTIHEHKNKVNYIVARKGDTYCKIAKEFKMTIRQLHKYNSFDPKKELLEPGDIVYLQPKRRRSKEKNAEWVSNKSMNWYEIAQSEGLRLECLMKMNNIEYPNETVQPGQKILLR